MKRKSLKILENITTSIESLNHEGRGVTHIEGKATFVSGALAHETVRCKVVKQHRRYNDAIATEVLTVAPERVAPPCQHFQICGGCSLQHMAMDAQLQLKQTILLEQLQHFGRVKPETLLPPLTGSTLGYRRKARLGVRYVQKKQSLYVGFREKFSNLLTQIDRCEVLHPSVGKRLPELRELIISLSQYEHIPQIEVAVSDKISALVFRHLTPLPLEDIEKLKKFAEIYGFHIYLQPNPPEQISKLWPEDQQDLLAYTLPEYQLELLFHPLDFTQINHEINQSMLHLALQLLAPTSNDVILDLFCGLGNFTLPIARSAQQVIGIEGSEAMVNRATKNAQHNNIENVRFFAANLQQPNSQDSWLQNTYDKILLDPPRTGAKEIIEHFPHLHAKRIVYVSCNPATLARDAGELVNNQGFKLKTAGIMNMFPHTSHIEAIALFEK